MLRDGQTVLLTGRHLGLLGSLPVRARPPARCHQIPRELHIPNMPEGLCLRLHRGPGDPEGCPQDLTDGNTTAFQL